MKKDSFLPSPFIAHLAHMIESVRFEPPSIAIRALKHARRIARRELRRHRKRPKCSRHPACMVETSTPTFNIEGQRRVQAPAAPKSENQPFLGLDFLPPNPGVLRRIMADGGYPMTAGLVQSVEKPPTPLAEESDDRDVLILAAGQPPIPAPAPAAAELPPMAGFDPAQSDMPADLPIP